MIYDLPYSTLSHGFHIAETRCSCALVHVWLSTDVKTPHLHRLLAESSLLLSTLSAATRHSHTSSPSSIAPQVLCPAPPHRLRQSEGDILGSDRVFKSAPCASCLWNLIKTSYFQASGLVVPTSWSPRTISQPARLIRMMVFTNGYHMEAPFRLTFLNRSTLPLDI
ncbi:predicted protein [Histoplasma capsulatum H143]|uniref:Uncharacterized protein n=1 Tax=Ajellomyces capsulatus (strain H143) TaxID=544712 RepID=C6HMB3_AJECH|nr:predicted protein [Histoplasma capsulatum H143]